MDKSRDLKSHENLNVETSLAFLLSNFPVTTEFVQEGKIMQILQAFAIFIAKRVNYDIQNPIHPVCIAAA